MPFFAIQAFIFQKYRYFNKILTYFMKQRIFPSKASKNKLYVIPTLNHWRWKLL